MVNVFQSVRKRAQNFTEVEAEERAALTTVHCGEKPVVE